MTATTAAHPTLSALRGALTVMEAADRAGLPIPTHVTTSSYAAVEFGKETTVSFQPETLADLHAWAEWLGADVEIQKADEETNHHNVDAVCFDQCLSLCFIEHAEPDGGAS